jgi:hypothetical protein
MGRTNRLLAEPFSASAAVEGGALPFFNDGVTGTVKDVKASAAGQLYHLKLVNTTAAVAYLQIFNVKAASVTLGTTVPTWTLRLAASESVNVVMATPVQLGGSGISIAGTTTATGSTGAAISVSALYA